MGLGPKEDWFDYLNQPLTIGVVVFKVIMPPCAFSPIMAVSGQGISDFLKGLAKFPPKIFRRLLGADHKTPRDF